MVVVIKELVIKGKVNGNSAASEEELMKLIRENTSANKSKGSLSESEKRALVTECVNEVLSKLNDKLSY
jgi:hypothetical protein